MTEHPNVPFSGLDLLSSAVILLDENPLDPQPDSAATASRLLGATVSATYVAGLRTH